MYRKLMMNLKISCVLYVTWSDISKEKQKIYKWSKKKEKGTQEWSFQLRSDESSAVTDTNNVQ